jgi:hypothetical protein
VARLFNVILIPQTTFDEEPIEKPFVEIDAEYQASDWDVSLDNTGGSDGLKNVSNRISFKRTVQRLAAPLSK